MFGNISDNIPISKLSPAVKQIDGFRVGEQVAYQAFTCDIKELFANKLANLSCPTSFRTFSFIAETCELHGDCK
jgi:hypothetical protein